MVRAVEVLEKRTLVCAGTLLGLLTVWSTVRAQAPAMANNPAEEARSILQAVEADESARELVSALVKLYKDNASTLTPDPLHSAFYDSHPPASIRIARLQSLAAH